MGTIVFVAGSPANNFGSLRLNETRDITASGSAGLTLNEAGWIGAPPRHNTRELKTLIR